jgi:hypothetical protein
MQNRKRKIFAKRFKIGKEEKCWDSFGPFGQYVNGALIFEEKPFLIEII